MRHRHHLGRRVFGSALLAALALTSVVASSATPAAPLVTSSTVAAGGDVAGPVDVGGGRTIYLECHGDRR